MLPHQEHGQTRAKPLPPDDRRRAIIDAVIPLIVDHGAGITTRQMAEAAGVSEGTLFKVFPDKPSILFEAIRVRIDAGPVSEAIGAIPEDLPMERQLEIAAQALVERSEELVALVSVLGTMPKTASPTTSRSSSRSRRGRHGSRSRRSESSGRSASASCRSAWYSSTASASSVPAGQVSAAR